MGPDMDDLIHEILKEFGKSESIKDLMARAYLKGYSNAIDALNKVHKDAKDKEIEEMAKEFEIRKKNYDFKTP